MNKYRKWYNEELEKLQSEQDKDYWRGANGLMYDAWEACEKLNREDQIKAYKQILSFKKELSNTKCKLVEARQALEDIAKNDTTDVDCNVCSFHSFGICDDKDCLRHIAEAVLEVTK